MTDVQFEEDHTYDSYIDVQRQIFYKPSTSPVVNTLIERKVFETEKQAGIVLIFTLSVFMIVVGFLFYHYVIDIPEIDTHSHLTPANI